jgi:hypothetical protein
MKSRKLMCVTALALFGAVSTALASNWYVDGKHGNDNNNCKSRQHACKTISNAIFLTLPGDSIFVAPAIYHESVFIPYTLKIIGSGAKTTIFSRFSLAARIRSISATSIESSKGSCSVLASSQSSFRRAVSSSFISSFGGILGPDCAARQELQDVLYRTDTLDRGMLSAVVANFGGRPEERGFSRLIGRQYPPYLLAPLPLSGSNKGYDTVNPQYSCVFVGCHLRRKVVEFAVSHEPHKPEARSSPRPGAQCCRINP